MHGTAWLLALAAALACVGCGTGDATIVDWELRTATEGAARAVTLPAHLDDGSLPRNATYTLTTLHSLPPRLHDRELDFVIPHFWAITRLRVDGERAVRVRGPVYAAYRETGPHIFRIPRASARDGLLRLELEVDHRWTQSAWFDVVPRLVPSGQRDTAAAVDEFFNVTLGLFAFAALMQIGLACLAIYFIGGRRRGYFWFGIQAVTAALFPLFTHGAMAVAFGHYDVPITAGALVLAIWVSLHFSYDFFELGRVPRSWDVVMAGGFLVCVFTPQPYLSTHFGARAAIGAVVAGVVVQSRLCIQQTLNAQKRRDARWYLACWMALAFTTWNECVVWLGFGDPFSGARISCLGLTLFSFFLSLLLSQRHMGSLEQGDRLNTELAARVQDLERRGSEVEQLNTELRRQIADRSEQIYAALALRDRQGAPPPVLHAGDVVQGRYRVARLLGAGGMGAVYEVVRLLDEVHLALKVTRETHGAALALLAREAQIASQLSHRNIVKVVDVDISSAGFLFVVMELVHGSPLSELHARYGELPWAIDVLEQVATGLSVLHSADIVHRDVKPPNIMVSTAQGGGALQVKIMDFGISRFEPDDIQLSLPPAAHEDPTFPSARHGLSAGGESDTLVLGPPRPERESAAVDVSAPAGLLTSAGFLAGTPSYMAPELALGGARATPAADIFSLGIVAWELLTGQRPCPLPAAMAVMQGREPDPIPSLEGRVANADPELVRLLDACLALDPTRRPTARELATALARVARGLRA